VTQVRWRGAARDERLARRAGFWWGLAEGLFFFIVPDVYITFATLFAPRAGAISWMASIAGSLVAVVLINLLEMKLGLEYTAFLGILPGITEGMIGRVRRMVAVQGLSYSPFLVLTGVPLKVYAAVAFAVGVPLGGVLLWTAFARIVRSAPSFAGAVLVRLLLRRSIDARPAMWCALLASFWFLFYIYYFLRMNRA
jgi:hypothetical protein